MTKLVLGKGLGALIPDGADGTAVAERYHTVPLAEITPNPMQPRQSFDDASLSELAASLKSDGMMQPLVVRQSESGYALIAGERRFRAARLAGLAEVPVVVMDQVDDTRMLELALVENIHREDLNPMELAEAVHRLLTACGLTQEAIASKLGKSRVAITNTLRLLNLPGSIQTLVRGGKLSEGHARALLGLESESAMLTMADQIMNQSLSVREVEHQTRHTRKRRLQVKRKHPELADMEAFLKQTLGTSVKIVPGLKKGRIEIEYYGEDDLGRLWELFRRISSV
jgi:ParB family transcriptional regulator, chromosome partitioning protein